MAINPIEKVEITMDYRIETRCIHGDGIAALDHPYGSINTPIFQTATFAHPGVGESTGYDYSRESNPTRTELERMVGSLEGAVDTVACSTGMAALTLCLELLPPGSNMVCTEDLYGGSVRLFDSLGRSRGLSFSYVDTSDLAATEALIQHNTAALYIETPSNPTMRVTDLHAMKRLADHYGLLLIVDNTFLSPYYQNPIASGADIVVHSGTKFLGGHNDTLAGFLCSASREIAEQIRYHYKTVGSSLSPFDSYLLIRGIKTLSVRMERQQQNAIALANWLREQPQIADVLYVGLPDHPGYEVNLSQARGFGSMISFHTDTPETALQILRGVKLISYAESLGGVESLITYPKLQTHGDVPEKIRLKLGITDTLLRFSVGIENQDDLIEDLSQALE